MGGGAHAYDCKHREYMGSFSEENRNISQEINGHPGT
jgi:hypothetical protein